MGSSVPGYMNPESGTLICSFDLSLMLLGLVTSVVSTVLCVTASLAMGQPMTSSPAEVLNELPDQEKRTPWHRLPEGSEEPSGTC